METYVIDNKLNKVGEISALRDMHQKWCIFLALETMPNGEPGGPALIVYSHICQRGNDDAGAPAMRGASRRIE